MYTKISKFNEVRVARTRLSLYVHSFADMYLPGSECNMENGSLGNRGVLGVLNKCGPGPGPGPGPSIPGIPCIPDIAEIGCLEGLGLGG